jgi:transcriptional regulator with XRE-family HTH domain/tetratricopeptide (TPR) repeat protein
MAIPREVCFADLLRAYRNARDLTQEELAEKAGLSRRGISQIESDPIRRPYRDTVARLADALGLTDAERTVFEAAARRGRSARSGATTPTVPSSPVTAHMRSSSAPMLVGRARELALIEGHLAVDRDDEPPLLLLAGEPGIGKSRLLAETVQRAQEAGWRVLAGGCVRSSGQAPYEPFVTLLARALAATPSAHQRLDLTGCAWLARLLPELADTGAVPAPEWRLPPEQERRLVFGAVARYLSNIAGPAGVMLLLDDLQWTGADAMDLLVGLTRGVVETMDPTPRWRVRIIGAYRSTEVDALHPLALHLPDLARDGLLQETSIASLSPEEASLLLKVLLEDDADDAQEAGAQDASDALERTELIEDVAHRTGGAPYFLVSFAQGMRQGLWADLDAAKKPSHLPWDVALSIQARANALGPATLEVLRAAAVIGRLVPHTLLATVMTRASQSEQNLTAALERADHARLLIATTESMSSSPVPQTIGSAHAVMYQFAHDLAREAILADMALAKRVTLHRAVAEAIEGLPEPGRERWMAELADHFAQAGEPGRALPYLLQAGDQAEAVYAHAQAELRYRDALEVAREMGDRAREAEALEKLGKALGSQSSPTDALDAHDAMDRAAQAYQTLGDVEGELRMLAALAGAHAHSTIERAEGALARILPRLTVLDAEIAQTGRSSPALALAILQVGGSLYTSAGRLHDALAITERGIELARATGDDAVMAWAHVCRGYVGMLSGSEGSLADFLDGANLAERANTAFLSMAINFVTSTYLSEGQLALAKPYAERALAVAERRQVPADIAFMRGNVGELALYRGDWDEAREHFASAAAIQERLDPTFAWGDSGPAQVYLRLLDLAQGGAAEESIRHLESLLAIMRERVNHPALETGALGEVALAERALLMGHAATASARLAAFLDQPALAEHARMITARVIAIPALAWAEVELGYSAKAAERLGPVIATTSARRWYLGLVDALRVKGLLAARQRRWADARAVLDETIAMCRTMPYPYAELKALYVYGQLEAARGDPGAARERFEQALAICNRLGEGLYRPHIERDLETVGGAPS